MLFIRLNKTQFIKLEKARDLTKLTKKVIIDKNGHRKTVYVKIGVDKKKETEVDKVSSELKKANLDNMSYDKVFDLIKKMGYLNSLVNKGYSQEDNLEKKNTIYQTKDIFLKKAIKYYIKNSNKIGFGGESEFGPKIDIVYFYSKDGQQISFHRPPINQKPITDKNNYYNINNFVIKNEDNDKVNQKLTELVMSNKDNKWDEIKESFKYNTSTYNRLNDIKQKQIKERESKNDKIREDFKKIQNIRIDIMDKIKTKKVVDLLSRPIYKILTNRKKTINYSGSSKELHNDINNSLQKGISFISDITDPFKVLDEFFSAFFKQQEKDGVIRDWYRAKKSKEIDKILDKILDNVSKEDITGLNETQSILNKLNEFEDFADFTNYIEENNLKDIK